MHCYGLLLCEVGYDCKDLCITVLVRALVALGLCVCHVTAEPGGVRVQGCARGQLSLRFTSDRCDQTAVCLTSGESN